MNQYSIKMRASKNINGNSKHISGAEKMVNENELNFHTEALVNRALHHTKGKADFINVKIEKIKSEEILHLDALPVRTIEVADYKEGLNRVKELLVKMDIPNGDDILEKLKESYSMRGAILLDVDSLERIEVDKERGIRATYMDFLRKGYEDYNKSKNHFKEAIVLATKVANAPNIIGEICISDDLDYVTGYVASKELGYVRITKLKEVGSENGGRIFLYREKESNLKDTISYLEKKKVVVENIDNNKPKLDKWLKMEQELDLLRENHLYRSMKEIESSQCSHVKYEGKDLVMMASNNYLNLSTDSRIKEYAFKIGEEYGIGSGGSRLTTGTTTIHTLLEKKLAEFKDTEAALVFNSGYMANVGTIAALCSNNDVIFSDELNHASIIDGCRLSKAKIVVYKHNDMRDLEEKILKHPCQSGLIVSDAVFSMDGDIVNLPELVNIADKYGLFSMIDEAHSTGVIGENGRGICEYFRMENKPDIIMGTLSKALGGEGGFVCGKKILIEFLKNKARSFIFSTSLSPVTMGSSVAAISLLMKDSTQVRKLQDNIEFFNHCLEENNVLAQSKTAIFPIIIGDEEKVVKASTKLFEEGYYISGIRYPTVLKGSSRLRVALMANHSKEELSEVAIAISSTIRTLD
ncbi:8-amino-7-oxononanoate synthase [Bacillus sp. JJ722]|uniref:8-amino-7-oxononanoate synthase n=1 Tax=Bacillus sp. JJ722 TaxID=3122973 RepID=UPI003000984A